MDFNLFVSELAKKSNAKFPLPLDYSREVEEVNALQLHTNGARPKFTLGYKTIKPETYEPRFDTLFTTRVLNRHPFENDVFHNWRLSVYSPVAKEIFDKFYNLCNGSILQPNNYSISIDDKTNEYINSKMNLDNELSDILKFILKNPKGYFAVVNKKEVTTNEMAQPEIECISLLDVIMVDDNSIAFKDHDSIIFIDENNQYTIRKGSETIVYPHNIGKAPFWKQTNSYLQPYQFWSEKLAMNMNDDDAITKLYSNPTKTLVEPECVVCQGAKVVTNPSFDNNDPNSQLQVSCTHCNGKGTMSLNPNDAYVIGEEQLQKYGGTMPDMIKFTTPDIGIPDYHLKRWQVFYERAEQSLYLSIVTNGVQSGEGKKEDRKDQYFFLQSISNYLFHNIEVALKYVSAFINIKGNRGEIQQTYISKPKQFDLMSNSDIINEFADLQNKTDDGQTLGEINYIINEKVFRDDDVQKRINNILYYNDPLFGVSGNALRSKLLSGIYTTTDKTIHEKGYKVLLNMAKEMTDEVFLNKTQTEIESEFINKINDLVPQTIF